MRWKEETFFSRVKNIFEVERFSGTNPLAIKQDYYGVLFLATLENILAASDQHVLDQKAQARQHQREALAAAEIRAEAKPAHEQRPVTQPQVNHAISYLALLERLIELLLGNKSEKKILEEMHHLFRTSPTRARPDRSFAREPEKEHQAKRLRWHKYGKKIIA